MCNGAKGQGQDAVFGEPIRYFLADAQIQKVCSAAETKQPDWKNSLRKSLVDATPHEDSTPLPKPRPTCGHDFLETADTLSKAARFASYEKAAQALGIATENSVVCNEAFKGVDMKSLPTTSHAQRVRGHLLGKVSPEKASVRVNSSETTRQMQRREEENMQNTLEKRQQDTDDAFALLRRAKQTIDSDMHRSASSKDRLDALLADLEAGGGNRRRSSACTIYDPASATGKPACSKKSDCGGKGYYKCVRNRCEMSRKGSELTFSTDSLLTDFAGVRFSTTRRFIMAIMGAAVDCLLLFDFHTQHGRCHVRY